MTFNEWKKNKTSLFAEVKANMDSNVFGDIPPESLDILFTHLYGNRTIPTAMIENTIKEVAEKISILYELKWTSMYDMLYNGLEHGIASEKTLTETGVNDSKRQLNRNSNDNVSAFNDEGYSPDSENVESSSEDNIHSNSRTQTEVNKSLWAMQQQLRMAEKNFIHDTVFTDVKMLTTLSIY